MTIGWRLMTNLLLNALKQVKLKKEVIKDTMLSIWFIFLYNWKKVCFHWRNMKTSHLRDEDYIRGMCSMTEHNYSNLFLAMMTYFLDYT